MGAKDKTGGPYKVFNPFWKNLIFIRVRSHHRSPGQALANAARHRTTEDLELRPAMWADGFGEVWTPGHHAAQEALTPSLHPLRPITMR